jgi:hypothetical protein
MANLKTYSVVINWNDHQRDEGTYGCTVRARDHDHAERIVRARMMWSQWEEWRRIDKSMSKRDVADIYAVETFDGPQYFGSLIECSEGASWKAADLEASLRTMRAAYGRLHDFLSDAIEGGRLKEADIPDDYAAIVAQLEGPCSAADDTAGKIIAEIDAL